MEAGITILLLVIVVIVIGVASVFFAGGLGVLNRRRRELPGDAELTGDSDRRSGERPTHVVARNDDEDVVFHGVEPAQRR